MILCPGNKYNSETRLTGGVRMKKGAFALYAAAAAASALGLVGVVTVSSFLTVSSTTDTSISFSKEISCSV